MITEMFNEAKMIVDWSGGELEYYKIKSLFTPCLIEHSKILLLPDAIELIAEIKHANGDNGGFMENINRSRCVKNAILRSNSIALGDTKLLN